MIYTPLTVKAARIAYDAHHGQYDVCGMPYIFHPFTVAESMTDEYSTCVALLHDVVEDTDVTFEDLEGEFPEEVLEAVRLMTHDKDVDYEEYVAALKGNPIARAVKLADVDHNADEDRNALADVSEKKREHWRRKYARAREILEGRGTCTSPARGNGFVSRAARSSTGRTSASWGGRRCSVRSTGSC